MASEQFDVTAKEKELILKRSALKESLKNEFLKQVTNPHRYGPGEPGYLFDPAVQRFMSMRATRYNYFEPTIFGFVKFIAIFVLPVGGMTYFYNKTKGDFEGKCRRGEISYRDRTFKFIN